MTNFAFAFHLVSSNNNSRGKLLLVKCQLVQPRGLILIFLHPVVSGIVCHRHCSTSFLHNKKKKLQQLHSECTLCQRHITFVVNHVMVLSSFSIDSTRTTCEGVWHRFSVKLLWQDCKSAFLVSERMHYIQLNGWKKHLEYLSQWCPSTCLRNDSHKCICHIGQPTVVS